MIHGKRLSNKPNIFISGIIFISIRILILIHKKSRSVACYMIFVGCPSGEVTNRSFRKGSIQRLQGIFNIPWEPFFSLFHGGVCRFLLNIQN
jgi:hypothetical protein